jgi:hypothetical protein
MFLAAALIPDTALLVPGAVGEAVFTEGDPARILRTAVDEALGVVLEGAERVVIVAPGKDDRLGTPPLRGSLGAAGVPDDLLGWPPPGPANAPVPGVPASVALFFLQRHLVAHHRANRDATAVEVVAFPSSDERSTARARDLRGAGGRLVGDRATVLVVVGSASGRHGPDAPLADDPRAPAYDDVVLGDLADAGIQARRRLADLDPALARELAVTGWAPWQVLLGAVGEDEVTARLLHREVLAGATHAVLTWVAAG